MTNTMSGAATSLRGLRDRPFELLKELEKRSRAVTTGSVTETSVGLEWVGVAFRMGGETFLAAREETREVLGFRRFAEAEFNAEAPPTVIRCDSYLAGAFRRGGEVWPVLSLKNLVESQSFLQAAS